MHVAKLELCRELYELSGWEDSSHYYAKQGGVWVLIENRHPDTVGFGIHNLPAYDLGYLLRKLPRTILGKNSQQKDGNFNLYAARNSKVDWVASYADADDVIVRRKKLSAESNNHRNFWWVQGNGSTPEDALCRLAIKLLEQGILPSTNNTKEDK